MDIFSQIPGLLSPEMQSNVNQQSLLSAAAGLLHASDYSPMPKSLAGLGAGGIEGLLSGQNEGLNQALKIRELTKPQLVKTGEDPFGAISYGWANPLDPGKGITNAVATATAGAGGGGGTASASGEGAPSSFRDTMDKIAALGPDATPEQKLAVVPSDYRNYVAGLNKGESIPANLGRGKAREGLVMMTKAVYPDFDEQSLPMRTQYARGLAQTSPSSVGGQKNGLNTTVQHLAELSDRYVELGNPKLPDSVGAIPGTGPVMNAANAVHNSSAERRGVVNAINENADRVSGELGKLYAGNTGGGEMERMQTKSRFSPNNNPQETVGALQTTARLLIGKMNAMQAQRDQTFGASGRLVHPIIEPETAKAIDKLNANIVKLGGTLLNSATRAKWVLTRRRRPVQPRPAVVAVIQRARSSSIRPASAKSCAVGSGCRSNGFA
jgi:hypothetical protein